MSRTIALPEPLFQLLQVLAAYEHVTVEEYLTKHLTEQLAGLEYLRERASRSSREKFEAALALVPDVEPEEHDRLP